MYILGINAYHGDSSACILKDGSIVAAIEEERFKRIKHWAGFPKESIAFCLKEADIGLKEVDYITISRDPMANLTHKVFYVLKHNISFSNLVDRASNAIKVSSVKKELSSYFHISIQEINRKIYNIEHHRSHMACSFFASPFKESAILSVDGFGDFSSTMLAVGKDNTINILDSVIYPHSLGIFYTTITQFLGFPNYGDEYKVMGLAPYGEPKYCNQLRDIIKINQNNGLFTLNKNYFRHVRKGVNMSWEGGMPIIESLFTDKWEILLGKPRCINEELTQTHFDIAASAQKITEETIFHMLNHLHESTGIENICITGGVAQNSVVNGKIIENTRFKDIYIPSAGHDAGTSIGSALYLYNHILGNDRLPPIFDAYFGSKFSKDYIIALLKDSNIEYTEFNEDTLLDKVVDKLIDGGVIGWFQGRAEFGSRALGNRSIIVDPRRGDAKDLLNKKIKRREDFRPFAPSILQERVQDYFEQDDNTPFMEKVFLIKEERRKQIPAVTHIDGTGRLHTVDKKLSPIYYRLIEIFEQRTGVPILLNTSFNENEPIVNSPKEALNCFLRTNMDMLVMENIIIERN